MNTERLIESLTLRSGSKGANAPLDFCPASVNVFVGPNHSGKSLLLRELQAAIQNPEQAPHRKVLRELVFTPWDAEEKAGLVEELRMAAKASATNPKGNVQLSRAHWSQEFGKDHFEHLLKQLSGLRDVGEHEHFRQYFLTGSFLMLGGAERLSMLAPNKREAPKGKYYVHLLSRLFYSDVNGGQCRTWSEMPFRPISLLIRLARTLKQKSPRRRRHLGWNVA